jgi:hypothetical protein
MTAASRHRAMVLHLFSAIGFACAAGSPSAPDPERQPPREQQSPAPESQQLWTDPVDFLTLRTEFGDRSDFAALCERDRPVREWHAASEASDWKTLLASTAKWLDRCPVDIDAHLLSAVANERTAQHVEAAAHASWFRGLVDSVLASGSGNSTDSPYVVISVDEEYAVLRALRLQPEGQTLLNGSIDAISTTDASGNESTVYFLPTAHWRRLEKAFGDHE